LNDLVPKDMITPFKLKTAVTLIANNETEKLKKGQFRKFRKAMEEELQNIRDANEKLFMSSNEVQHKFDLQQSKLQELKQNN
jgi:hypothetical protein